MSNINHLASVYASYWDPTIQESNDIYFEIKYRSVSDFESISVAQCLFIEHSLSPISATIFMTWKGGDRWNRGTLATGDKVESGVLPFFTPIALLAMGEQSCYVQPSK